MLVLSSLQQLAEREDRSDPVVILADAADGQLVEHAVRLLGVEDVDGVATWRRPRPVGRPGAVDLGEEEVLALSLAMVGERASLIPVRALCCATGLLQHERRQALGLRKALMAVEAVFEAQHRLVDDDEDVLRARLSATRQLAVARHRFAYVSGFAHRMYGAVGDELSQQSSLITEQLTMVNTVFLPLTLGAAFFGMNFGWMTDRVGSWQAFVVLGMGVPVVLGVVTVFVMGRLRRRVPTGSEAGREPDVDGEGATAGATPETPPERPTRATGDRSSSVIAVCACSRSEISARACQR